MTFDRLRRLCAHYLIVSPLRPWGTRLHPYLDLLDQRAGIGTRGGTRLNSPHLPKDTPVNYVGVRLALHEARLAGFSSYQRAKERQTDGKKEVLFYPVAKPRRRPARHYFHLGAEG